MISALNLRSTEVVPSLSQWKFSLTKRNIHSPIRKRRKKKKLKLNHWKKSTSNWSYPKLASFLRIKKMNLKIWTIPQIWKIFSLKLNSKRYRKKIKMTMFRKSLFRRILTHGKTQILSSSKVLPSIWLEIGRNQHKSEMMIPYLKPTNNFSSFFLCWRSVVF